LISLSLPKSWRPAQAKIQQAARRLRAREAARPRGGRLAKLEKGKVSHLEIFKQAANASE